MPGADSQLVRNALYPRTMGMHGLSVQGGNGEQRGENDMESGTTAADDANPRAAQQNAANGGLEILIAIVLAVAGLASAWASFRGGIWDKRGAESYAVANSQLTESSQMLIRSGQEQAVCAALFLQWLDAQADRQALRADVIANHMPPWCSDAFASWRRELPDDLSTLTPNSPLPVFAGPSLAVAKAARAKSDAAQRAAESAGRTGDSYDVANVILATALFLAGISSILHGPNGRRLIVLLAGLLTVGALILMVLTDVQIVG